MERKINSVKKQRTCLDLFGVNIGHKIFVEAKISKRKGMISNLEWTYGHVYLALTKSGQRQKIYLSELNLWKLEIFYVNLEGYILYIYIYLLYMGQFPQDGNWP